MKAMKKTKMPKFENMPTKAKMPMQKEHDKMMGAGKTKKRGKK